MFIDTDSEDEGVISRISFTTNQECNIQIITALYFMRYKHLNYPLVASNKKQSVDYQYYLPSIPSHLLIPVRVFLAYSINSDPRGCWSIPQVFGRILLIRVVPDIRHLAGYPVSFNSGPVAEIYISILYYIMVRIYLIYVYNT